MKVLLILLLLFFGADAGLVQAKTPGEVGVGSVLREARMQGLRVPDRQLSAFRGKPLLIGYSGRP